MSNEVFPTLGGLGWSVYKTPEFKTAVKESASGVEFRGSFAAYPSWTFNMVYNVLRDDVANNELKTIVGFFCQRRGRFDSFLFTDPDDYSVTDQTFGTGNSSTTQFQLLRAFGGFSEPVQNVNVLTNIKKNGVTQSSPADYTISSTGLVTFTSPPTTGHALTWTGTYYFRCRFLKDSAELEQFMKRLWQYKKCEIVGSPWNKYL